MPYRSVISQSASSDQVEQELYKLMTMQTRVYIVHMLPTTGSILFKKAKEIGMMTEAYVWILTDGIANIVNSLSPSVLDTMDGALGVRFHVPRSKALDDSTARWNKRYRQDYPDDPLSQLSIYGLWGHDAVWALALAAAKVYDAAIGDITIRHNRTSYADFTLPYTESGIAMIVPVKDNTNKNTWIFLKPLTGDLWFASIAFLIYTGIVIWLLERRIRNAELTGSFFHQLGTAISFSFFADRERVDGILARLVVAVWVFVLLIITSSYTANLSSMLTVQKLQPTETDVHELLKRGEYVGNGGSSSYVRELLEQLGFERSKIRAYTNPDDFADALDKGSKNGGIAAAIHEVPYIKLFLAKHCKGYTMVGPIYKSEGFGFAFPKRSPLVDDFSRAILKITEADAIIQIEKKWIGDEHACKNDETIISPSSLNFKSFSGLFLVTGVASTSALLITLVMFLYKNKHKMGINIGHDHVQRGHGTELETERIQESTADSNILHRMIQMTTPASKR
ncbi:hypothetical protein D1007_23591 [Hordeum vulgare]|nr:hypothetical protein D1007_23591 [Hordeum vulgare]